MLPLVFVDIELITTGKCPDMTGEPVPAPATMKPVPAPAPAPDDSSDDSCGPGVNQGTFKCSAQKCVWF